MAYIGVQGEDAAAYSSRNAVSLAFAAVFLTAANALGSNKAMRASFIVDLRDDTLRDSTWKMSGSQSVKTSQQCCTKLAQVVAWQQRVVSQRWRDSCTGLARVILSKVGRVELASVQ